MERSIDELSINQLIKGIEIWYKYIRSKFNLLIIFGIIGCLFGYFYSINQRPYYIAKTTFVIDDQSGSNSQQYSVIASQLGFNIPGNSDGLFTENNIAQLIMSRLIIGESLLDTIFNNGNNLTLADLYLKMSKSKLVKKSNKKQRNIFYQHNYDSLNRFQDSVLTILSSDIINKDVNVFKPDKKANVIELDIKSSNPNFAFYFSRAIFKNVSNFYIRTKTEKVNKICNILFRKLDSVKRIYQEKLYYSANLVDKNANTIKAIVKVPQIKSQLEAQLLGSEYLELSKNLEIQEIEKLQQTPLFQIVDSPIQPLFQHKLSSSLCIVLSFIIIEAILILILSIIYYLGK